MAKKNTEALTGSARRSWKTEFKRDRVVYMLFLPIIIYEVVLHYLPMFGIVMAFEDYNVADGYMPSTYSVSDTVYTYTYRQAFGGGNANYSLSAASGLFQSVISTILLVVSNNLSRKTGSSLF